MCSSALTSQPTFFVLYFLFLCTFLFIVFFFLYAHNGTNNFADYNFKKSKFTIVIAMLIFWRCTYVLLL